MFYYLQTAVIMPDHVHLLLTPLDTSLAETMKRIKGASAREVNRELGGKGSLWQREYFDREIRSSENLRAKGEYIANNPVRVCSDCSGLAIVVLSRRPGVGRRCDKS